MPLYIAQSGDLDRCHGCPTDGLTVKDGATQLLIKYKSGALNAISAFRLQLSGRNQEEYILPVYFNIQKV